MKQQFEVSIYIFMDTFLSPGVDKSMGSIVTYFNCRHSTMYHIVRVHSSIVHPVHPYRRITIGRTAETMQEEAFEFPNPP